MFDRVRVRLRGLPRVGRALGRARAFGEVALDLVSTLPPARRALATVQRLGLVPASEAEVTEVTEMDVEYEPVVPVARTRRDVPVSTASSEPGETPNVVAIQFPNDINKRKDKNMGDKKNELSFEGDLPVEKVVAYLRELANGFESGSVPVESGSNRVVLNPSKTLEVEVKARVKKRESSLKLEICWEQGSENELRIGGE